MRKITLAAARTPDGKIWSVPRPGRHDAVLHRVIDESGFKSTDAEQGFVDDEGDFYTRAEALELVTTNGQLDRPLIGGGILTSEDLWDSWRCGWDVNKREVVGGCGHIYEKSRRPKPRRGQRVNRKRTTTCPKCGKVDALHPKPKDRA